MSKLMNIKCCVCQALSEAFIDGDLKFGDTFVGELCECGHDVFVVLPCAPSVRTPMNSVSYLDGHRDDGLMFQQRLLREETRAARAKQQGDHVTAVESLREVNKMKAKGK
jgi:hypothetical protein